MGPEARKGQRHGEHVSEPGFTLQIFWLQLFDSNFHEDAQLPPKYTLLGRHHRDRSTPSQNSAGARPPAIKSVGEKAVTVFVTSVYVVCSDAKHRNSSYGDI